MTAPLHRLYALTADVLAQRRSFAEAIGDLLASPPDVQTLLAASREARALSAQQPRDAEILARLLLPAAESLADLPLEADCVSTLLLVCNLLGRFTEAIELAQRVIALETTLGRTEPLFFGWLWLAAAYSHNGELRSAEQASAQAKTVHPERGPREQAFLDHVDGNILTSSNQWREALERLTNANAQFAALGMDLQAARALRDRALALSYYDAPSALPIFAQSDAQLRAQQALLDLAINDYGRYTPLFILERFDEALDALQSAFARFEAEGATHWAMLCRTDMGLTYISLQRYAEAEAMLQTARAYFAQHAPSHAARCDLNLAYLYQLTNRPWDALPRLQAALDNSLQSGRFVRAARCFGNLGEAYKQLGQYDKALDCYQRARRVFAQQQMLRELADSGFDLARLYSKLAQDEQAESAYLLARTQFADLQMHASLALCEVQLAELYLNQSRWAEAEAALARGFELSEQQNLPMLAAVSQRLLAEAARHQARWLEARAHLTRARTVFAREGRDVQLALCDLVEGELELAGGAPKAAAKLFERAHQTFAPLLPAEAWRALDGLARCALAREDERLALRYTMRGIRLVHHLRASLPSEQLSSIFYKGHRHIFETAFQLASQLGRWSDALTVAETMRTTTFALFLEQRGRPLRANLQNDPHVAELLSREAALARELSTTFSQIDLQSPQNRSKMEAVLRASRTHADSTVLKRLKKLAQDHAETIEQLRLAARDEWTRRARTRFSLAALRRALTTQVGERWLCVAYQVSGERLTIFSLDSRRLHADEITLTPALQRALQYCTSHDPQRREAIYRGTLGGHATGSRIGTTYLRQLHDALIPPRLRAQLDALDLLMIVPAGRLHGLPFQALQDAAGRYLIERAPIAYAPSLHALQILLGSERAPLSTGAALLCGLAEFDGRAPALPYARDEIDALTTLFTQRAQVLWDESATTEAIKGFNARGALEQFGLLHFATHSIRDPESPLHSRILLHDAALTAADILDLRLGGALVTLSTCESGVGSVEAGDELLDLARVFFYAGAQTLVASLWAVEDRETQQLMVEFYQQLLRGARPARALQQAQIARLQKQKPPYHWAAFSVIGHP